MRVAVVGAGIMGCATAWALTKDDHDVVLYEQFRVGNDRGSSHGRSRIVRLAYPEAEWVRMAQESMRGWRELEQDAETQLLELNGLVELVGDPAQSSRDALEAAGAEFELVDAEAARARWPIGVPDGWVVLYQPEAGIVRADLALRAFLDCALERGAELHEETRVEDVAELDADAIVVTAGAWVGKLVDDVPVRPTRETLAYYRRGGGLPSIVQLDPETRGHALYSLHDPKYGLKAGLHHAGIEVDPDEPGEPNPELLDRISAWVAATYRDVDPTPVDAETCLYTNTEDESFIFDSRERVFVCSACSGHGFKFAPVIGKRMADLAGQAVAP
jgi:monomeric sarcosine oxidase